MQIGYIGGIGDLGKFALLRYLRQNRRLAVCWYLTDASDGTEDYSKHFEYLKQPDKFRHLAPELYDRLVDLAYYRHGIPDPLTALQSSGVLEDAVFVRQEVPKRTSMRPYWAIEVANRNHAPREVFSHLFRAGARDSLDHLIGATTRHATRLG